MHIPISEMEDGRLYFIKARNATIGLYKADKNRFQIVRSKFGSSYLCHEYHWDTGSPFGTAKPLAMIEDKCDNLDGDELKALLTRLSESLRDDHRYVLIQYIKSLRSNK